jgi:hypothetical protein
VILPKKKAPDDRYIDSKKKKVSSKEKKTQIDRVESRVGYDDSSKKTQNV